MASAHEMDRLAKEKTIYDRSQPGCVPAPPQQPVQSLYDQVTSALSELRDQVSMLDERLGYVSATSYPSDETGKEAVPERSPLAHNLYCVLSEVNRLAYRVQDMRNRLEI